MSDASPFAKSVKAPILAERMARWLYSGVWLLIMPAMVAYLLYRARKQPDYRRHWGERFGFYGAKRTSGQLIWVHAVSVGETRAAQPLIRQLRRLYPDHQILLTNGTPTGRATNAELFGHRGVLRCYLPYDFPWCVHRFLNHFKPQIGILMEAELWPNLVAVAQARQVPLALVNARLSEKSLASGLRWSALIRPALAGLALIVAQTERDKSRLAQLGCQQVQVSGNLKFDVVVSDELIKLGRSWSSHLGGRQTVLLASSRDGEEQAVLTAWHSHGPRKPLLIVVPRHPERFESVFGLINSMDVATVRRADLDAGSVARAECLLGDSMGEMFAYYGAADLVIMGGSLLPFGGQNLIEACAAGVPVIVGPHTFNFEEVAEEAVQAGAAVRVVGAQAAVGKALELLSKPAELEKMRQAALSFASLHRGATVVTMNAMAPLMIAKA
ncbi:MAG: lipid IV(A) 3-deoxy-D-manno-octulosonic acid transferase [Burkholderiaceae bacterium]